MDQGNNKDAPALVRRRRKIARQQRDKTPEPPTTEDRRQFFDDESSNSNAEQEQQQVQHVRMQIRLPPGNISAHKSKILSRRDKNFTGAAVRSSSTPRHGEENEITGGDCTVIDLMKSARRSLSSPRHKEESSESGQSSPRTLQITASSIPKPPKQADRHQQTHKPQQMKQLHQTAHNAADKLELSRLEQNLRKFEEERNKFEMEKRKFEREKREMRHRRFDPDERRRIVETYRRLSDRIQMPPSDSDERHFDKVLDKFREIDKHRKDQQAEDERFLREKLRKTSIEATARKHSKRSDYDSSTVLTSSSEDLIKPRSATVALKLSRSPPPVPERRSLSRHSSSLSPRRRIVKTEEDQVYPAPIIPSRRSLSRHSSSLSPRRRTLLIQPDPQPEHSDEGKVTEINGLESKLESLEIKGKKKSFFSKMFSIFTYRPKRKEQKIESIEKSADAQNQEKPLFRLFLSETRQEWKRLKEENSKQLDGIRLHRNKCIADLIVLALFCGFGGLLFRFVEGGFEHSYKCGVRRVKRDFIDHLWLSSHNMREEDWKSAARTKLRAFEEELHTAHEAGVTSNSGTKAWSFVNSVLYIMQIVTTIGYGNIAAKTTTGQVLTIVYAIIGIPMFLILLADFGKLFTRGIKFLWAYVRRLYYTGSLRKVRKQAQVQEMMRGFNMVYDIAIRRPSMYIRGDNTTTAEHDIPNDIEGVAAPKASPESPQSLSAHTLSPGTADTTPTSPYPETLEIDDEFNLPVSLATGILLFYIFIGALAVYMIQKIRMEGSNSWSYFESVYFVFISMSTIGFGDYFPDDPIFMVFSIVYLVFGLALTSMCINVVQTKLSDSFKQASAKIGATIGLSMAEEEARNSQNQTPTTAELASVHSGGVFGGGIPRLDNIPEVEIETASPDPQMPTFLSVNNNNNQNHYNSNITNMPPALMPKKSSMKPGTFV